MSTGGELLRSHLEGPLARAHVPRDAFTGAAGGAACGDLIRVSIAIDPDSPDGRIADAGFDASGCGATVAAGSAAVGLLRDAPLLAAARIGTDEIAAEHFEAMLDLTKPKARAAQQNLAPVREPFA